MNKYQELLQVLEKEHQITCEAADIEETDRAKAYFQLLGNLADKALREINELATMCYQYEISKQDLFLLDQIKKRNISKEVKYLLDHKLSLYELESAYRAKGFLG